MPPPTGLALAAHWLYKDSDPEPKLMNAIPVTKSGGVHRAAMNGRSQRERRYRILVRIELQPFTHETNRREMLTLAGAAMSGAPLAKRVRPIIWV